jgi:hypothetical protein
MTLARLLAAAFMLCSLSVFAQDQQMQKLPSTASPYFTSAPAPSEPWSITANSGQDFNSQNRILNGLQSYVRTIPGMPLQFPRTTVLQSQEDLTCYTIRSMKVARDNKDSDATHLVGSSTCQPANRYQMKSAVLKKGSSDR